tara:strand:+ start:178 stop:399 length:222 start_codon:yes stop_codon:yes gene_type:complete
MDLIPITKIKIKKEKWLQQKIKYEEDLVIDDVLNIMCKKILSKIFTMNDYYLIIDEETFCKNFKDMIYNKYIN